MIRPRIDRGETRLMKCLQGIVSRIDESVVVGQRTVLTNVTFRLNLTLMPGGNTMKTDLRHGFEGTQTSISNLIGRNVGTQSFAVAQRVDITKIVVTAGMRQICLA